MNIAKIVFTYAFLGLAFIVRTSSSQSSSSSSDVHGRLSTDWHVRYSL